MDNPVLAALGLTRGQMLAAALIEIAVAGAAGAILAAGVAVAASPLMPIGAARLAEPDPGASADWLVLCAGAVIIVVLLAARTLWPAWRLASVRGTAARETAAGPGRRSWLAGWLAGAGAPVTMTAGARLATEPGRGAVAVPVRAALAGTMLSVLAVTAAFTFGANLLHLVHSPRLYGQTWDAAIDLQFSPILPSQAQHLFGANPGVTGWTYGYHGIIGIDGHLVPAIGLTPGRGPLISPTLLAGRAPRTGREIVLGSSTLHDLGLHVGQEVPVTVNGRQIQDRIVGQAVFPNFGQGAFTPTDLGEGAETTATVLAAQAMPYGERPGFQVVLLRLARGPGRSAAITRFRHSMAGFCADVQQSTCLELGQRPNGVTDYARIDGTPEVLAGVLAGLGVAVLAQLSVVSGRRRQDDFAVLKALGLLRRQVSQITAWQVSKHAGRAGAADRAAAGGRRGPVELAAVRRRPGRPRRCQPAGHAAAGHGARRAGHRQRGGAVAGPVGGPGQPGARAAYRVTAGAGSRFFPQRKPAGADDQPEAAADGWPGTVSRARSRPTGTTPCSRRDAAGCLPRIRN